MTVILILAALVAGMLLSFSPVGRDSTLLHRLAFACLAGAVTIAAIRLVAVFITDRSLKLVLIDAYTWGKALIFLLIGFCGSRILQHGYSGGPPVARNPSSRSLILSAAAVVCAAFFWVVSIGKSRNAADMEAFFVQSGYPAWLNYVVMVVECVFSVGLLLWRKPRVMLLSVTVLGVIMAGAVGTHVRNGDPLEASYDALVQLINLLVLAILVQVKDKAPA